MDDRHVEERPIPHDLLLRNAVQKEDIVEAALGRRLLQRSLHRPVAEKEDTYVLSARRPGQLLRAIQQRLKRMRHAVRSDIAGDELVLEPMLFGETLVLRTRSEAGESTPLVMTSIFCGSIPRRARSSRNEFVTDTISAAAGKGTARHVRGGSAQRTCSIAPTTRIDSGQRSRSSKTKGARLEKGDEIAGTRREELRRGRHDQVRPRRKGRDQTGGHHVAHIVERAARSLHWR